ncbi:MAG TPA: hypothetical protein VGQ52_03005 [Gemmatimonadaceae bacterium]|jgi:hypothetical protein|nr:hypothetical protein [Gemmatimonadaceae bacterium]
MKHSIVALALLATISAPVLAHPKGTIRLASKQVGVGGELIVRGETLPKNETLRLQLRGTLETFPLAEVRTNATGAFQARLALPLEARTGNYSLVVVAPDGDVAAQAELIVVAAAAPAAVVAEPEHLPEHATPKASTDHPAEHTMPNTSPNATDMPHASAEMMEVQATPSAGEWVGILAIVVASLGGGVALLFGVLRSRS